jgi:predicted glycosyltransferase involved in capsule biosynthesis
MNIKVAVVIPWRETKSRLPVKNYVEAWYRKNLPEAKIIYSDSGHKHFNLSASRNAGALQALDYDVIIHNDADTIPNKKSLIKGIKKTYETGYFCNPYDTYHMINTANTYRVLDGLNSPETADYEHIPGACSGVVITTPNTWKVVGGFDENFLGWGYEDVAIAVAHGTMMDHGFLIIPGVAYAMSHDVAKKPKNLLNHGKKRLEKYMLAASNKELMFELIGKIQ